MAAGAPEMPVAVVDGQVLMSDGTAKPAVNSQGYLDASFDQGELDANTHFVTRANAAASVGVDLAAGVVGMSMVGAGLAAEPESLGTSTALVLGGGTLTLAAVDQGTADVSTLITGTPTPTLAEQAWGPYAGAAERGLVAGGSFGLGLYTGGLTGDTGLLPTMVLPEITPSTQGVPVGEPRPLVFTNEAAGPDVQQHRGHDRRVPRRAAGQQLRAASGPS